MRQHIVILTEDSKPATGGIAEYLHQLAIAMSGACDVVVVTSVAGAEELNPGLPFQYREVPWFRSQVRLWGDRVAFVRQVNTVCWRAVSRWRVRNILRRVLQEYSDAAVVLGRVSHVTLPWIRACQSLGVSCVAFAYGRELKEEGVSHIAQRVVAHWFPISEATAQILASCGVARERMTVLLPGIAARAATQVPSTMESSGTPYLLSVGMLRSRKGIDLAIQAFAALASDFPDLRYVIVGDGPERQNLERLAHEAGVAARVEFLGEVNDATRDTLMQGCTLFVLPVRDAESDMEGFGIVFLEAAQAGKAVVAGRTGGVIEAVVDGTTGVLVDTHAGIALLSQTLRHLLEHRDDAERLGQQGQRLVTQRFSWGTRAQQFATAMQLARRGRLRTYQCPEGYASSIPQARDAVLHWVQRAMGDGSHGAPAAYHVTKAWGAPYPEVTGYLIPTLLSAAEGGVAPELARIAFAAGDWLVKTRLPSGAICRKQWYEGNAEASVFNTAQVLEGWSALAQVSGDERWRDVARAAADWLVVVQEPDGSWVRHAFNGCAHTYYARAAAILAEFGVAEGCERYVEAGQRALQWVVEQQQADGWFAYADFTPDGAPTTHTIGYILEGLLRGAVVLQAPVFRDAAQRAAEALYRVASQYGGLPGRFVEGWKPVTRSRCVTGEAQIGIGWSLLACVNEAPLWQNAAQGLAQEVMRSVRVVPEWPEISGGVPGSVPGSGDYDPYQYPMHAAKFALDLFARVDA